ncbi:Plasma-membrane_choline transporter and transmembrane domain-containing protein [Hexamita inflata]|uniref:Choline transporter-like protein n=2 Tax=Hexamita inflata TaxID=28002 RepID=A0ABP1HKR7_9EUKA
MSAPTFENKIKPATSVQQVTKSQVSPIVDPKKRKCRDLFCTIWFILFWAGVVAIIIVGAKNPDFKDEKVMDRAFLYIRPGDEIRRMCGYSGNTQPDILSADYSAQVRSAGQMELFCGLMKSKHSTELASIDCSDLIDSVKARAFMVILNQKYNDMTSYPAGLRTFTETICVESANCKQIPAKAMYACHREFYDLYTSFTSNTIIPANKQYYTEAEYLNIISTMVSQNSNYNFMRQFCVQLPSYQGADSVQRDDFVDVPLMSQSPIDAHYCIQDVKALAKQTINGVSSLPGAQYIINYFNDMGNYMIVEMRTQQVAVIVSCCASLVIAYVVLLLMKIFVWVIVWGIVVLFIAGSGLLAAWLIKMGLDMQQENEYRQMIYGYVDQKINRNIVILKTCGSIFAIISIVSLFCLCCFFRSIRITVAVINTATDALRKLFMMVFLPLVFVPIVVGHLVWTVGAAYFYNCMGKFDVKYNEFNFYIQSVDPTTHLITQDIDYLNLFFFLVIVFAIFWGVFFFYSVLEFILSSMITQWYFSTDPKRKTKGFLRNALRMLCKQVGTLVFSSCITAIVVWIRWFFEYVYKRIMHNEKMKNNKTVKALAWVVRTLLYLLQKFIQYTNRNTQVLASITGESYCKSAKMAIKFEFSHMKTVFILNTLGDFFLFLAKVFITVLCMAICYAICKYSDNPTMIFTPVLCTCGVTFCVAFYIIEILELTVDTIFMAFLYEDTFMLTERSRGVESFAPKTLSKLLSDEGKTTSEGRSEMVV